MALHSEESQLRYWLQLLANGERSVEQVFQHLKENEAPRSGGAAGRESPLPPAADVRMDVDRARRCGYPEVIYAPGKSSAALIAAFGTLLEQGQSALVTRCEPEQAALLRTSFPQSTHNELARTIRWNAQTEFQGRVAVVTAGTSDRPVAEEALETLLWMGVEAELLMDVGVAGPQRFLREKHRLEGTQAIVVVAGMEGALASVVAGWVPCPVVAVPTSVGYGTSLGGIAALLSMLNSCAANVSVVNIDAGFKGGYLAGMIARQIVSGASELSAQRTSAGFSSSPASESGTSLAGAAEESSI